MSQSEGPAPAAVLVQGAACGDNAPGRCSAGWLATCAGSTGASVDASVSCTSGDNTCVLPVTVLVRVVELVVVSVVD